MTKFWLFVTASAWLLLSAASAQNTSPTPAPTHHFKSQKEFEDTVASYFPPGALYNPDGSPDVKHAVGLALYLRDIGEPPLPRSAENPHSHAYRLHWTAFPGGKTLVIRLQIDSLGSGKIFVKKTAFDSTNLLLSKEESVPVEAVDRFLDCVKRADFWRLPAREDPELQIPDGSYWYLEGAHDQDYHMVYRRNPELRPGPFTEMGRSLAKELAHLDNSVIDIPPYGTARTN